MIFDDNNWQSTKIQTSIKDKYYFLEWKLLLYY